MIIISSSSALRDLSALNTECCLSSPPSTRQVNFVRLKFCLIDSRRGKKLLCAATTISSTCFEDWKTCRVYAISSLPANCKYCLGSGALVRLPKPPEGIITYVFISQNKHCVTVTQETVTILLCFLVSFH